MPTHEGNQDSIARPPQSTGARGSAQGNGHSLTAIPPKTGRTVVLAAVAVIVLLVAGFIIVHAIKSHDEDNLADQTAATADQAPPVDVVPVAEAPASQNLQLPGETAAWLQSTVYARVSGYIGTWNVDIGDRVKKGQELCTIETPELDADLNAAQAKLNVSKSNVKIAQADAEFARTTYERWWDSPKGVVSEQERQEKKAQYDSSVAKVDAANAQVASDQAAVDRLVAMEAFKHVAAPFDGVITERKIDIGDLVTAGSAASDTWLYTVAQADRIRTFIDVPQNAAAKISIGRAASIVSDADRDRHFTGTVSRSSSAINVASRTLRVEVDIANPELALMPGMYVEVTFDLKQSGSMQVPASALVFRASGPEVAIVGSDNKVSFRPVTIAQDNGDFVQISSGPQPGDRVALNISSQIAEGDVVAPEELKDQATRAAPTKTVDAADAPAVAAR